MNDSFRQPLKAVLILSCLLATPVLAEEEHGGEHEEGEENEALVLDATAREKAGVTTETITRHTLKDTITVPAEVVLNAYETTKISPRITSQIVRRLARLGDHVKKGQPLVTLSSVAMADAQGALIVAAREWQRVRNLGKGAVSEKRYTEAQVSQQLQLSRVLAYGMSRESADRLMASRDATLATGEFDLLSPQSGTVLMDDFIVGELIEPGRVLFTISDESRLWVEAQILSNQLGRIKPGYPATVAVAKTRYLEGRVVQIHHRLDETTRTQGVRIEIVNVDDALHPGQFAEVTIATGDSAPVISVPADAITLNQGAPVVFVLEDGNEFHPRMVKPGERAGDRIIIQEGLEEGDIIASQGVFHLKSLMLKSTLGEGHGH